MLSIYTGYLELCLARTFFWVPIQFQQYRLTSVIQNYINSLPINLRQNVTDKKSVY